MSPTLTSRPARLTVNAAAATTQRIKAAPAKGTQRIAKPAPSGGGGGGGGTKVISVNGPKKNADFRSATPGSASPPPRILARVQQLRLLSKAESAGLLSAAERAGVTLSALESSGALSAAESLGLLSRAADRGTPGLLYGLAAALFAVGPAAVFLIPDSSAGLIALQAVAAGAAVVGGSAAWGGASLLSALQK